MMTANGRPVRDGVGRRMAQRRVRRAMPGARALLRSVLLGAAVFTLAALTGALLSGAATTPPPEPPPDPAIAPVAGQPAEPAAEAALADSLIFSGAAGLVVSVCGLVLVTRRRRLW
jgi:ABC-type Fe3+ transport system permease subunit